MTAAQVLYRDYLIELDTTLGGGELWPSHTLSRAPPDCLQGFIILTGPARNDMRRQLLTHNQQPAGGGGGMINRPRIDSETVARVIVGCRATTSSSHKTQSRPLIALWRMRRSSQGSGRDPLWLRSCLVRPAPCDLLSKASLVEVLDNLSMLIECEPRTRRIEFRRVRPKSDSEPFGQNFDPNLRREVRL